MVDHHVRTFVWCFWELNLIINRLIIMYDKNFLLGRCQELKPAYKTGLDTLLVTRLAGWTSKCLRMSLPALFRSSKRFIVMFELPLCLWCEKRLASVSYWRISDVEDKYVSLLSNSSQNFSTLWVNDKWYDLDTSL